MKTNSTLRRILTLGLLMALCVSLCGCQMLTDLVSRYLPNSKVEQDFSYQVPGYVPDEDITVSSIEIVTRESLWAMVTATQLHIRSGPGTDYDAVGSLTAGQHVEVLDSLEVNGMLWGKTQDGWICLDYTELYVPGQDPTPELQRVIATVTCATLNVRSGAGTSHSVVSSLTQGDRIAILALSPASDRIWAQYSGGWVSMEYLYIEGSGSANLNLGGTVTASELRVRSGAGTSHSIVRSLTAGDRVVVQALKTAESMVWGLIGDGWVALDYVDMDGDIKMIPGETVTTAPPTASISSAWVHITEYTDGTVGRGARGGVFVLYSDGTFSHYVQEFISENTSSGHSYWYCPGTETSGMDSPSWRGTYRLTDSQLKLHYTATVYAIYDENYDYPVYIGQGTTPMDKTVTLQITRSGDGKAMTVQNANSIPLYSNFTTGSFFNHDTLYRASDPASPNIGGVLDKVFP